MADLVTDADSVTVTLSAAERVEALHRDVSVPRSAIVAVRAVPDGMAEVHGLRVPGTGLPGVIMVGTWRSSRGTTFAVCHGRRPAVVIDLTGQAFDRLVVTVDDPQQAVASLTRDVAGPA